LKDLMKRKKLTNLALVVVFIFSISTISNGQGGFDLDPIEGGKLGEKI